MYVHIRIRSEMIELGWTEEQHCGHTNRTMLKLMADIIKYILCWFQEGLLGKYIHELFLLRVR